MKILIISWILLQIKKTGNIVNKLMAAYSANIQENYEVIILIEIFIIIKLIFVFLF